MADPGQSCSRTYDFEVHAEVQENSDRDQINFKCNFKYIESILSKSSIRDKFITTDMLSLFTPYSLMLILILRGLFNFFIPKLITLFRQSD